MLRYLRLLTRAWFVIVLAGLAVYVGFANQEYVRVQLPSVHVPPMPGYVIFGGFFILGCAWMSLYFAIELGRKSWIIRRLSRELDQQRARHPNHAMSTFDSRGPLAASRPARQGVGIDDNGKA